MSKSGKVILIVVLVLAVGLGIYVFTKDNDSEDTSTNESSSSSSSSTPEETPTDVAPSAVTITYSDSGFNPSTITVASGSTVTVKNDSSETLGFRSDPHPTHTTNSELNISDLSPGESQNFTVTSAGTWGYHNHLNPDQTGTIVVE